MFSMSVPATRVRRMLARWSFAPLVAIGLAACTSTTPVAYQGLSSSPELRPDKNDVRPYQYLNANVQLSTYSKIFIDTVAIYTGSDAQFGSVSAEDRKIVADYLQQQFAKTLGKKFQIVDAPGPGTVRLHLTLTGVETSTPVLSTVSHLAPIGIVINGGAQIAGANGTFFGSVTYAVELSDSESNNLIFAYVTKQTPNALDVTSSIGYLDAAKAGIRIGADWFQGELLKMGLPSIAQN